MIPKNIYRVSINLNHNHRAVKKYLRKAAFFSKGYNNILFTELKELDDFVNQNYSGEIVDCYNKLNILVAKIDFWRYLYLYKFGGIYIDMDSTIKKNINDLIREDDQAIITMENNFGRYVQWCLIFKKNHPILKNTIDVIVKNIKENSKKCVTELTGPVAFAEGINKTHIELFDEEIDFAKHQKRETNIRFEKDNINYRLFGIDYNDYCLFKDERVAKALYSKGIKHWVEEQKDKNLVNPINILNISSDKHYLQND